MITAGRAARSAGSAHPAVTGLLCLLSTLAAFALAGAAFAGGAFAYSHEWRCKPANDTWCFDPKGLADWRTGKVKLEKGYNAYLCVGVFKEGWSGAALCTESPAPAGGYLEWKFGTSFSAHDPLHGAGLQENSHGNAEEIWNWFYEP